MDHKIIDNNTALVIFLTEHNRISVVGGLACSPRDKVCQWFSLNTPVSSTNKTDCHDITEIL